MGLQRTDEFRQDALSETDTTLRVQSRSDRSGRWHDQTKHHHQ